MTGQHSDAKLDVPWCRFAALVAPAVHSDFLQVHALYTAKFHRSVSQNISLNKVRNSCHVGTHVAQRFEALLSRLESNLRKPQISRSATVWQLIGSLKNEYLITYYWRRLP